MYFSLSSLTILSLAMSALSAPIPAEISTRQAFVPKLTFTGADYRDYYYIDAPGDGTFVYISMRPVSQRLYTYSQPLFTFSKGHIGSL